MVRGVRLWRNLQNRPGSMGSCRRPKLPAGIPPFARVSQLGWLSSRLNLFCTGIFRGREPPFARDREGGARETAAQRQSRARSLLQLHDNEHPRKNKYKAWERYKSEFVTRGARLPCPECGVLKLRRNVVRSWIQQWFVAEGGNARKAKRRRAERAEQVEQVGTGCPRNRFRASNLNDVRSLPALHFDVGDPGHPLTDIEDTTRFTDALHSTLQALDLLPCHALSQCSAAIPPPKVRSRSRTRR